MEDVRRVAYALRSMEFAVFQDKWPPDFLPACTDFTSVWEIDETEPNLSHPPLFSQIVTFPQISTYCLLSVFPETSLSQQRSTPIQISDAFSRGHDPSLMPAGPDAQHTLDPSSMSVLIVIVTNYLRTLVSSIHMQHFTPVQRTSGPPPLRVTGVLLGDPAAIFASAPAAVEANFAPPQAPRLFHTLVHQRSLGARSCCGELTQENSCFKPFAAIFSCSNDDPYTALAAQPILDR